jgi:hypothetical protein
VQKTNKTNKQTNKGISLVPSLLQVGRKKKGFIVKRWTIRENMTPLDIISSTTKQQLNSSNCLHCLKFTYFSSLILATMAGYIFFLALASVEEIFTVGMRHLATGMSIHQKTSQSKI